MTDYPTKESQGRTHSFLASGPGTVVWQGSHGRRDGPFSWGGSLLWCLLSASVRPVPGTPQPGSTPTASPTGLFSGDQLFKGLNLRGARARGRGVSHKIKAICIRSLPTPRRRFFHTQNLYLLTIRSRNLCLPRVFP